MIDAARHVGSQDEQKVNRLCAVCWCELRRRKRENSEEGPEEADHDLLSKGHIAAGTQWLGECSWATANLADSVCSVMLKLTLSNFAISWRNKAVGHIRNERRVRRIAG